MNIKKEEITFTDEALITIAEQYTVDCGAREMEDYIERSCGRSFGLDKRNDCKACDSR